MNRRSFLKKAFGSFLAIIGISGGTYYYAREIEPSLLQIHQENISSANIPSSFEDFKIIQFSDTHIGFHYTLEQFNDLVRKINELKPDLIVFTGDLVDEPNKYHWNDQLIQSLRDLQANHGKFWIYGNHDHGGYGTNIVKKAIEQSEFELLKNEHTVLEKNKKSYILPGNEDDILGTQELRYTIKNTNTELS